MFDWEGAWTEIIRILNIKDAAPVNLVQTIFMNDCIMWGWNIHKHFSTLFGKGMENKWSSLHNSTFK